jgi:hypothetical protein
VECDVISSSSVRRDHAFYSAHSAIGRIFGDHLRHDLAVGSRLPSTSRGNIVQTLIPARAESPVHWKVGPVGRGKWDFGVVRGTRDRLSVGCGELANSGCRPMGSGGLFFLCWWWVSKKVYLTIIQFRFATLPCHCSSRMHSTRCQQTSATDKKLWMVIYAASVCVQWYLIDDPGCSVFYPEIQDSALGKCQ